MRRPRWSQFASETYKVDTIVYGTYNIGTWSVLFQLLQVQFRYRLKIPKQPEQDSGYTSKIKIFAPSWKSSILSNQPLSPHNSATVNSVSVNTKNTKNRKKTGKTRHGFADACMILRNQFLLRGMSYCLIYYIFIAKEMGSDLLHFSRVSAINIYMYT